VLEPFEIVIYAFAAGFAGYLGYRLAKLVARLFT
jgi:hypothetical protein